MRPSVSSAVSVDPPSPSTTSTSIEIKHLADRLNAAQIKVKRLARLEAAIADFVLEITDRTASLPRGDDSGAEMQRSDPEHESAYVRAKRKDEHLKKAEKDPIALLNSLRTHLRIQFMTQEQLHYRMQNSLSHITSHSQASEKDTIQELQRRERESVASQEKMSALVEQQTLMKEEHKRITRQYKRSLEQLNVQLHDALAHAATHDQRLSEKQNALDDALRSLGNGELECKRLEDELVRLQRYGAAGTNGSRSPVQIAAGDSIRAIPGPNDEKALPTHVLRVLHDYEKKQSKLETTNDELRRDIQRLHQQIVALRHSTQMQHTTKLERDAARLEKSVKEAQQTIAEQESELLRTKGFLKQRDELIKEMKVEYNKVFMALQKVNQTPSARLTRGASSSNILSRTRASTCNAVDLAVRLGSGGGLAGTMNASASDKQAQEVVRAQANENPYLRDHYLAKIEQLENEIERLQTQLRKMIASEYRHKQKNKLFRAERGALLGTCDQLQSELERAVQTTAKAMTRSHQRAPENNQSSGASRQKYSSEHDENDSDDDPTTGFDLPATAPGDSEDERSRAVDIDDRKLSCTVNDVKRLRLRNQFLENRFRVAVTGQQTKDQAPSFARPTGLDTITGAATTHTPNTFHSLQSLQNSQPNGSRVRPKSALAVPRLGSSRSAVVVKSLM